MINLYTEKDYENAVKLKKKLLTIYFIVFGVIFAVCAVIFTAYLLMPYPSSVELTAKKNLYEFLVCAISVAFILFSFAYLCVPYRRAKYYLRMLDDMKIGEKITSEGTFMQNETKITEERFVEYKTMVVIEWSDKTQEYMRRNILVDKEKSMPDFKSGDIVKYVTHANMLMAYGLKSDEDVFEEFGGKDAERKV